MEQHQELINVYIRPHLVSFLFQELDGEIKAIYSNKKIKLAHVTNASILGRLIHVFRSRAVVSKSRSKISGFSVFLSLDKSNTTETKASINSRTWLEHSQIQFLDKDVQLLNDHLDSIFRISLVQFVKGYAKGSTSPGKISKGVHEFMLLHNLYDTELDPESLRKIYYNGIKKKHLLSRLQVPISNKTLHFYSA
ncbi:hypothetical protein ACFS5M_13965 [Lacinutrix iliipiscaria]|uniref:Uncharacterized protein n=1 Tax=Lacinutrix iliipiscaria TaxID=1230532 RepID=A0ABW5WQM3_9FLAO